MPRSTPEITVIGAGFSGLSAACHLADAGARVTVVDRHPQTGGRARTWVKDGFHFDMGPSWYWMPDVFERFFASFGYRVDELYDLRRLDPSYRLVWEREEAWDVPAGVDALRRFVDAKEPGAGAGLDRFLRETKYTYEQATQDYLLRPSLSFLEFFDARLLVQLQKLKMLRSMHSYATSFFDDPKLVRLASWPVLFLGASAKETSAMYALMSYADMALGTWYPMGGMHRIIEGMVRVAEERGVTFRLGEPVREIALEGMRATGVRTDEGVIASDAVVASADYHHVESQLLPARARQIPERVWQKKTMSPSSLLFYLGVKGEVPELPHHTLFFDEDLDRHMDAVYTSPRWPARPLFYVCAPTRTDASLAPKGHENLFLLIPLAPGLQDDDVARERTYHACMERLEKHVGRPLRDQVVLKRSYAMRDFEADYAAFQGNAYGMANTLRQTGPLKPPLRSKKVAGLYFAGQMTVPGPGMPPSLVSGELAAKVLMNDVGLRPGSGARRAEAQAAE
ncbi:MAG: phytoene desaturase family protein [Myxococcota bacterium]